MADPSIANLEFGGLMNSVAENRVPRERCWRMQNCSVERGIIEPRPGYALFGARTTPHANDIGWGLGYGKYSGNELQEAVLTGIPTGGTLKFKWRLSAAVAYETITGTVPWNCTAAQFQTQMLTLPSIRSSDILVGGGPWPLVPIVVEFLGQYANTDVDPIVIATNSLTGGTSPALSVTETVKGGVAEEYLAAVQKNGDTTVTMYSVDPSTGVFTEIATGLNAGEWFFLHYKQRVYASNEIDGIHFKVLGGRWDDGRSGNRPLPPPTKPTITLGSTALGSYYIFDASTTYGTYVGWGSNPTPTANSNGVKFLLNAALNNATISFEATLTSVSDFQWRDYGEIQAYSNDGTSVTLDASKARIEFINSDGTPITIEPDYYENKTPLMATNINRKVQFADEQRSARDNIAKVRVTLFVTSATAKSLDVYIVLGDGWPNDTTALNLTTGPTRTTIEYAYTYFRASDSVESQMSATGLSSVVPPIGSFGKFLQVACPGSTSLSGSDIIAVYRKQKGTAVWRLVGQAANDATGASVTINDHYMEHELAALPEYGDLAVPGVNTGHSPRALGVWKQCVGIGFQRQLWLSYVGQPETFVASRDNPDAVFPGEDELDRGSTEYVADNRSEEVLGIVGQDSCYIVTPLSSYAKVGDSPADASPPRRLPGSRGALGYRSFAGFGGGIEVASQDGLWYYSVGRGFSGEDNGALAEREETLQARRSYEQLVTTSNSRTIVAEHNDEVWVFNGTKYMVYTRSRLWNEGTFADTVKAVITSRIRGFRFMDAKGRIHTLSATYTTDNGTAINWEYETGLLEQPRVHLKKLGMYGTGTPSVEVTIADGRNPNTDTSQTFTKGSGQLWINSFIVSPGTRFKLRFFGVAGVSTVESVRIAYEGAPSAWQN